ncbi:hypothetical protein Tco_0311905 [Tanacetum coccineum]
MKSRSSHMYITGDRFVPIQDSPNFYGPLPNHTSHRSKQPTNNFSIPPQPQQGPSDPILIKRMGELEEFIVNLVEENQDLETRLDKQGSRINKLENYSGLYPKMIRELDGGGDLTKSDMKEILLQRMLEENYDKGLANHRVAYEALQDSIRRDESEDFDVDKAQEETYEET